jgi:tripartite-type tricarboxylate transporter receptor subunit TctC
MLRRRLLIGAALSLPAVHARAARRLELIVGARTGTAVDTAARAFAPFLERHLPQMRLRVVSVSGEAGAAALRTLAGAGEGVMGWVATPTLMARMVERPALRPLLAGLRLVGAVQKEPVVFVASPASPADVLRGMLAPGGRDAAVLPLATPPAGSPAHLAVLRLQAMVGHRLEVIAFPTAAAARQAVQAGNVGVAALGLTDAIAQLRVGQLARIAVASPRREPAWADLQPLADLGPSLAAVIWRGLALPPAAPEELVLTLRQALRAVVADPEFRDHATSTGFAAGYLDGPAWQTQANTDGAELAALWAQAPWRPEGLG